MEKAKAVLTIEVTYDCNGETAESLKARLEEVAQEVANKGLLSASGPCEVVDWSYEVEVTKIK